MNGRPSPQSSTLACDRLTYAFPGEGRGVFEVTLEVSPGEACALVGANGAGKTTLLNLCLGYLAPRSGSVRVAGWDMASEPGRARAKLAYVPEVARLYDSLTGLQNLAFFEGLMGRSHPESEVVEILEALRFPTGALREPTGTYSKGMRQKIAIAMGLLKRADVFLLDEPTSGLDFPSVAEVSRLVRGLTAEGKAVLFSSHDLSSLLEVANTVAVLHQGRLVLREEIEDFRRRDASAFLQGLYGPA
ncbi:MAG TPA: ABC transporter ATP-binding protein [Thermoanaerobaculia bacterium]